MHLLALVALLPTFNVLSAERADTLLALPPSDIFQAFPAVDTVVPVNGRLVLFGGGDLTFVRTRGDGAEETLEHVTLPGDSFALAHIVTLPDLIVGETLVVSTRCDACSFSGSWTVGVADERAPAFDDGPSAVDVQPNSTGEPFAPTISFVLQVRLPGARDTQSPVAIELRGDEVKRFGPESFGPGQPINFLVPLAGGAARTVCFNAVAVDTAGNEGVLANEVCADLVPARGGCAQASRSTTALAMLALLLLLVVRRRREVPRRRRRCVHAAADAVESAHNLFDALARCRSRYATKMIPRAHALGE